MVDLNAAFLRAWILHTDPLEDLLSALSSRARGRMGAELRGLRRRADALAARLTDGSGTHRDHPAARKVLDHLYRVTSMPLVGDEDTPDPGVPDLVAILQAAAKERDLASLAEHCLAGAIHDDLLGPMAWRPLDLYQALDRPAAPFERFLEAALAPRLSDDLSTVALSVHGTPHLAPALRIAAWLKARRPDLVVVLGGPWCAAAADVIGGDPSFFDRVDGVCPGEGERPLAALVEALRHGRGVADAAGFLVRDGGRVRFTGASSPVPLGELGPPDYSDVDWDLYRRRVVAFRTVRGCIWSRCVFCYHVLDDTVRRPPPFDDGQADALRSLVSTAVAGGRVEGLVLADNATPFETMDAVAAILKAEGAPLPWESMARLEPGITTERAAAWVRGGCRVLGFGLETSDTAELRRLRKGIRPDNAEVCLAACAAAGIEAKVFALDYPSQPPGAFAATLRWLIDRRGIVAEMTPLRFELGRGSGAWRDPDALGLRPVADHEIWYDVFGLPFNADDWQGPEAFWETTEQAMVEFAQRRHADRGVPDRSAFPPADALAAALATRGATVTEEVLDATTLTVRIRHSGGAADLRVFDAEDPTQHYKLAGRYKVAYSGPMDDMEIMEELVRFLQTQGRNRQNNQREEER